MYKDTIYCDFSGSKFAAYGMMESLREELRTQGHDFIPCTVVCPSLVRTQMITRLLHRITIGDRSEKHIT